MKWIEITIYTTEQGLEPVYACLDDAGVSQVIIEPGNNDIEALLNETAPYWDYASRNELTNTGIPSVKAYIADINENQELIKTVQDSITLLKNTDIGVDLGSLEIDIKQVDDEDWSNNWKAYYKPFEIGTRLLVKPAWEALNGTTERIVLAMEPGMVFGTGTHQTTRMCMELIESNIATGDSVLDLGCGSGILSVTALLLGAGHAVAVDVDPLAEQAVSNNAQLNNIPSSKYEILIGNAVTDEAIKRRLNGEKFDIVLANIVSDVIIALAPSIAEHLKQGGKLITSGIITEREAQVEAALKANGLSKLERIEQDDWLALLMEKD